MKKLKYLILFALSCFAQLTLAQGVVNVGSGGGVADSTRLVQDSILVYYQGGVEIGRDTISATGTTTQPAGSNGQIQFNLSGAFGASSLLTYNTADSSLAVNGIKIWKGRWGKSANTAVGESTLTAVTTGTGNTAIGSNALRDNTIGVVNTAVGYQALLANTIASNNCAFGYRTLYSTTDGGYNAAMGAQAMNANTSGGYNAAFGYHALYSNTTGSQNTALGYQAGRYITGSSENTSATNSVFVGAATKAANVNQTNQIVIGHGATGLGDSTAVLGAAMKKVRLGDNLTFKTDQTIGAGQDNYVLTYDHSAGTVSLEAAPTAVDNSVTNEGALSVGAAGANTSQIITNTAGDGGVILKGAGIVALSESADTITITATEVDGSITNELDNLDAAYNNFGANPSKITVDAAESQTGGLEIESVGANNITIDLQGTGDFVIQDAGTATHYFYDDGSIVFNENGASTDFRVEASLRPYLFNTSGAQGTVGIGLQAPASGLATLTVQQRASEDALRLNDSSGNRIFSANGIGYFYMGGTNISLYSNAIASSTGNQMDINILGQLGTNAAYQTRWSTVAQTQTTGVIKNFYTFEPNIAPTSGSVTFIGLKAGVYMNSSGTYSGESINFLSEPTIPDGSTTGNRFVSRLSVKSTGSTNLSGLAKLNYLDFYVNPSFILPTNLYGITQNAATMKNGFGDVTAPTATVHIAGSLRYVDGNQALGKTIISDANGVASWGDTPGSCQKLISQTSHGFVAGDVVYWTGTAYANVEGNFSSTDTPSGIVYTVPSANSFMLSTCGILATDFTLADGVYYATDAGLSTTPSEPQMPVIKVEGSQSTVYPFPIINSQDLFTITTTNGANSIDEGETFVLNADSVLLNSTNIGGAAVTNLATAIDRLQNGSTYIVADGTADTITITNEIYTVTVNTNTNAETVRLPAPASTYDNVVVIIKQIGSATNAITVSAVGGASIFYETDATSTSSTVNAGGSSKSYQCVNLSGTRYWIVI